MNSSSPHDRFVASKEKRARSVAPCVFRNTERTAFPQKKFIADTVQNRRPTVASPESSHQPVRHILLSTVTTAPPQRLLSPFPGSHRMPKAFPTVSPPWSSRIFARRQPPVRKIRAEEGVQRGNKRLINSTFPSVITSGIRLVAM
jgi:hypothetical protein